MNKLNNDVPKSMDNFNYHLIAYHFTISNRYHFFKHPQFFFYLLHFLN